MLGHDSRLGQVFNNLIDNARSFCRKGGRSRVAARPVDDTVEVIVDDEGPGIRADQFERIFERFYTDRPEQEAFGQNSGLGLSISKQIVEAHRGTHLGGEPHAAGKDAGAPPIVLGARFIVRLPADERAATVHASAVARRRARRADPRRLGQRQIVAAPRRCSPPIRPRPGSSPTTA